MYVHVPWCRSRCGYCDFNTYVPGALEGASPGSFVGDTRAEIALARRMLADSQVPVSTVFVGGGTPTMLKSAELVAVLEAIDTSFGLAHDAEITTEANPETVTTQSLSELREGGFTRISFGMQSAVEHVLRVLDREHTPGRTVEAVGWAKSAGFEEISVDLIYGTPGESDEDWQRSLDVAVTLEPTHVSAYSLIVEPGTRMARQVARGELPAPDEDVLARRYEMADSAFTSAGLDWYEVSNWARGGPGGASVCRHNLGYWHNDDWLGLGPGAHSHIGGVRWWNVKHPGRHSGLVHAGSLPVADFEVLSAQDQRTERIMLGLRLAEGLAIADLAGSGETSRGAAPRLNATGDDVPGRAEVSKLVTEGLLDSDSAGRGQLVLTNRGRLLADLVVRRLAF